MKKIFLILMLILPATASGAVLVVEGAPGVTRVGDTFPLSVSLHTEDESINALEGSVLFPESLRLVSVRQEGSLVPLWVVSPHEESSGVVTFAGVIPGGYRGAAPGNMFTLIFVATAEGGARVSFGKSTVAYTNDGEGSVATLSKGDVTLQVEPAGAAPRAATFSDTTAPEPFVLSLVPGESFGVEGHMLIWNSIDKGSGVAGSLVCIGFRTCTAATSPYALREGDVRQLVRVRVTDRGGNMTSGYLFTFDALLWHLGLSLAAILAVIACFILYRFTRRAR